MSGTTKQTIEVDVPDGQFAFAMTCAIEPDEYGDHSIYWPSGSNGWYSLGALAARGVVIPTPQRAFRKGDTVRWSYQKFGAYPVLDVLDDGNTLRVDDGSRFGDLDAASEFTLVKAVDA